MYKAFLLGLPALTIATSCVPQDVPRQRHAARAETDSRALLRRLALTVPDTLSDLPARLVSSVAVAPAAAPAFVVGAQAVDDARRAADCLTAAVYYEARSESVDGQRAVAQVVLNRVRDRAFPASVCGVVYQGATRRTGCQFSFTCDGSLDRPREPGAWSRARGVADAALAGAVYTPVGSATHYHASSVQPWWAPSLSQIGSIGTHIFYRWRSAMERVLAFRQAYAGTEPVIGLPTGVGDAAVAVAVHYGGEDSGGVTVHRGGATATAAVGTVSMRGVRIHVGTASAASVGGAIVSDETDPI